MSKANEIPEGFELAEVSAAKNAVWSVLDGYLDHDEHDSIEISERIIEDLMKRGVLVPEWFPDPHREDTPAQGYYPTASQMEAWEGRKITATRVTGR